MSHARSQGLLRRKTTVYRSSRMSKQQADALYQLLGQKCRIGMYVATTTAKSSANDVREWQEEKGAAGEEEGAVGGEGSGRRRREERRKEL